MAHIVGEVLSFLLSQIRFPEATLIHSITVQSHHIEGSEADVVTSYSLHSKRHPLENFTRVYQIGNGEYSTVSKDVR